MCTTQGVGINIQSALTESTLSRHVEDINQESTHQRSPFTQSFKYLWLNPY